MTGHANSFLLLSILALATILLLFGMKYFSASRQARMRFANESAYRELAERTAATQSANAASLAAVQADLSAMRTRLAAIDKVLHEV